MIIVKIAASLYLMLATISFALGFAMPSATQEMLAQMQTRIVQPALTEVDLRILLARSTPGEIEWQTP